MRKAYHRSIAVLSGLLLAAVILFPSVYVPRCRVDSEVRRRNSMDVTLMRINRRAERRERMSALVRSGYSTNEAVSQIVVEEWEKDSARIPDYIKRTPKGRWHMVDPKGTPYVLQRSATGVVSLPD